MFCAMRVRRLLLATTTLATTSFVAGCHHAPTPVYGNPKGSHYDAAVAPTDDAATPDNAGSGSAEAPPAK
jgi:hypothetical protein